MEFRRMPLPAARHTLSYVGATRRQESHPAACAHTQVRGVLWRSQYWYRQTGHGLRTDIQWRILPALLDTPAQAPLPRQAPRIGAGQRQVPPRPYAPTLATCPPQGAHAHVPAAIQSRTQPSRAGLETHPPTGDPQSPLPNPRPCHRSRARALQPLGQIQSTVDKTMRHYLRRCV